MTKSTGTPKDPVKLDADDLQIVGQNVATFRAEMALSQQAVADAMTQLGHRWDQKTTARVERGERVLTFPETRALSRVLRSDVLQGTAFYEALEGAGWLANFEHQAETLRDLDQVRGELAETRQRLTELRESVSKEIDALDDLLGNTGALAEVVQRALQDGKHPHVGELPSSLR